MAKIIEFRNKDRGDLLYRKYYETASDVDKWYIRETLALNLHRNSYQHHDCFARVKHILGENTTRDILGFCSAWYITSGEKEHIEYIRKLSGIIAKHGVEIMGYAGGIL